MSPVNTSRIGPAPIIAIHVLAFIGVAFWLSMIVGALTGGSENPWAVVAAGIVLGGAHIAISRLASLRSTKIYWAMWFVFISDSLLALFVDQKAIALVLFTVVLLLLTRIPSAKSWFGSPALIKA